MKNLVAIIVGGTGQFGIVTSNLLLKKKFKVVITSRTLKKKALFKSNNKIIFHKLNIYSKIQIRKLFNKYKPDIVFYFAGQSSPAKSFYKKVETYKSNVIGCKNFLEIIYKQKYRCKFLNASSCEIFGKLKKRIQISSPKHPINPYGVAKLKSFEITKYFREKHNIQSFNAVIFNTESFFREESFLIPKICIAAIKAKKYNLKTEFGNLKISREWNWCPEQARYLLKFLSKSPQDFILSNGKGYTAIQMLKFAFEYFNLNYKDYIITNNKNFLRKKDILKKDSNWKYCLNKNNINRRVSVYGKKLIITLLKYYLKKNKNNSF